MKNIYRYIALAFALASIQVLSPCALPCRGQERTVERTYISTDRPYYASGDRMYCSAFCLTPDGGKSPFSAVAYLELYSIDGHSVTGKVALLEGRGAGYIDIPSDLPTGNYRLIAYTAVNKNENGFDYTFHPKTISIYNTSTTSRVAGGVTVSQSDGMKAGVRPDQSGNLSMSIAEGTDGEIQLSLDGDMDADISLSIYHDEGLPGYDNGSMSSFLSSIVKPTGFSDNVIPEYDGEIVSIKIEPSSGNLSEISDKEIFISTPGSTSDIYSSKSGSDGVAEFFTTNIYGKKDMAIEIKDYDKPFSFTLLSPFEKKGNTSGIPSLTISPDMEESLSKIGQAMQVTSTFDADTLYSYLPTRALPFTGKEKISYVLDDYTRFSTMRDIFIEYLFDITTKRDREKGTILSVTCQDKIRKVAYTEPENGSLILLDGVPVFDHDLIYEYDPSLVKRIDVYPYIYFIGGKAYDGIANFVTFKGNMPSFSFGPEVKIADFNGAGLPIAITGEFPEDYPNLRETIFWNPLLKITKGKTSQIGIRLPDYSGTFTIVAEGIDSEGKPIYRSETFTIE